MMIVHLLTASILGRLMRLDFEIQDLEGFVFQGFYF